MPDVFTDEAGTYDLSITTSADWTVSSGGLPNGDNYVTADGTIAGTYNVNGDDFNLADGTAWTIEFWFYYTTAKAGAEVILACCDAGTATYAWNINFTATEAMQFTIINTASGNYLAVSTGVLSASTWHHLVFQKDTGNTVRYYLDNGTPATSSAVTGTARTPTGTYRLYLGSDGAGGNDINSPSTGVRIAKLAIYNSTLTAADVDEHYLAMTAV